MASVQNETDVISEDEITQWCHCYHIPHDDPEPRQMVREYINHVMHNSYFTEAVVFNFFDQMRVMCVLALSCPESTRLQGVNQGDLNAGIHVTHCYWSNFVVYIFEGLMMANFSGICEGRHNGTLIDENLGQFIIRLATSMAGHCLLL